MCCKDLDEEMEHSRLYYARSLGMGWVCGGESTQGNGKGREKKIVESKVNFKS